MKARLKKGSKAAKDYMQKLRNMRNLGAIKIVEKGESKNAKPIATYMQKRTKKGTFKGLQRLSGNGLHKDTRSHNINVKIAGTEVQNLPYGEIFGTTWQMYLVKFQFISFQLLAVTGEGLKKALKHPEGKNQKPTVFIIYTHGLKPRFEKMDLTELKKFM